MVAMVVYLYFNIKNTPNCVITVKLIYTLGTKYNCSDYRGVLILEVHLYCIGTTTNCPDSIEVSIFLSVHNIAGLIFPWNITDNRHNIHVDNY